MDRDPKSLRSSRFILKAMRQNFIRRSLRLASVVAAGFLLLSVATAQNHDPLVTGSLPAIEGITGPITWQNPPTNWKIENKSTLTIEAGKKTDWFASPMDDYRVNNTPRLLFKPAEDFVLSAKVTVDFHSHWDSGALVLYVNDSLWAKLCFEMTLEKHPAIVSVVTRDTSDDNNSIPIDGPSVYLKVAKNGLGIFFYASQDGQNWSIIRSFSLGSAPDLHIGFSSQSPAGDGCKTVFSQIQYLPGKVDLWSGK
jgi:regulation of enolase protein 1 (concanavalin A-like superfamily)